MSMALVQCKECNREISDRAATCAQCGYPRRPPPWTHLVFKIVIGLAATLFLGMVVLWMVLAWVTRKPIDIDMPDPAPSATSQLQDAPLRIG
ncbi:hypothetical protein ACF3M1_16475 [Luteimonas sp. WGS1318]|uniref:hypothetical protein n=1 Tax=Luteimonas sp. WGS1318 TaxID=3366815 RepID=UPI00372D586C